MQEGITLCHGFVPFLRSCVQFRYILGTKIVVLSAANTGH